MGDVEQFHFPPDVDSYVLHPCLMYAVGGIKHVHGDSGGAGTGRRTRPFPALTGFPPSFFTFRSKALMSRTGNLISVSFPIASLRV